MMKGKNRENVLNSSMVMVGKVVLLLSLAFVLLPTLVAAQPVKVWVNAPEYVAEEGTFVATIDVDNLTNFSIGMFDLSFESSVMNVKDVTAGSIDDTGIPIIMWGFLDDDTIRVMLGLSGVTTVSGAGYLAKISFEAIGVEGDESVLDLSNGELVKYVFKYDRAVPEEITAEWIDAKIKVLTPTPTSTPTPSPTPSPTSIPVTTYVPDDYPTIQSAVDNSEAGDTIIVRAGNYIENVKVSKRLTIQSENGSDLTIVRTIKPREHVFVVTANCVSINGFTIKGVDGDGIHLHGANYCHISDNNISNTYNGIYLYDSSNNTIAKNRVSNNTKGIYLLSSSNNTIRNNSAVNNDLGISLDFASSNNMLMNNDAESNLWGISLTFFAINSTISNNILSNNGVGINLWDSSNNVIKSNNVSNNSNGINLDHSGNNTIMNNNVSNNSNGINLLNSSDNRVEKTTLQKNKIGIKVHQSSNNTIKSNNASDNVDGIYILHSSKNVIESNIFVNDGLFVWESYDNKIENNTVNEKPLVYLEEVSDYRIEDAGQVILVKCANISAENLDLSSTNVGIELFNTSNSKIISNNACSSNRYGIYLYLSNDNLIKDNNVSNNEQGIYLDNSNNNTVTRNTVTANKIGGIYLLSSGSNSILKNNCSNNKCGIHLGKSNDNRISNNNCSSNTRHGILSKGDGIHLDDSNNNSISNNICLDNEDDGIHLGKSNNNCISENNCTNNGAGIFCWFSRNNNLTGNVMVKNGIHIGGDSLSDYTHEIAESNTVNGKSVYYWNDVKGGKIPDGAGQVILVNCSNVTVENQNLNNASIGIEVAFSSFITIKNNNNLNNIFGIYLKYSSNNSISTNTYSNNVFGIYLKYSNNNSISNNNCSSNNRYGNLLGGDGIHLEVSNNNIISHNNCSSNGNNGFRLYYSNTNVIYLNNIVNNTDNVYSYKSTNLWSSDKEITYTYNGTMYTNYLGNYWDDYTGTDADGDGIGGTPYNIDKDRDNYLMMEPWENYYCIMEEG
jgi:parallel beta-helix repeat protein